MFLSSTRLAAPASRASRREHWTPAPSSCLAIYLPSNCTVETSYYNSAGATWARTAWDEFLVEFTPATTQCNCRTDSECGPGMHCVDDWSTDVPFCEHD